MATVVIYTVDWCGFCRRAERLLASKGVEVDNRDVTDDPETRNWLVEATGRTTVPQVFINGVAVGGSDDLAALDRRGELDRLLAAPSI
ncbi:MAG: glutaredoxin 3 [Kofleriaceae bacterium]